MHKPVNTRDTAVRVRGVSRCAKNLDRTRTRSTRFGSTAGLTVPVLNATLSADDFSKFFKLLWLVSILLVVKYSTEALNK